MSRWQLMGALAFGLYAGGKGLTWWRGRRAVSQHAAAAYLLAWPGMNLRQFAHPRAGVTMVRPYEGQVAALEMLLGSLLLWGICPRITDDLARGWVGMVGIFFLLHFGVFRLLSLMWRNRGRGAEPLFDAPLCATSLGRFWSRRWNLAFHQLIAEFVYRPGARVLGVRPAVMLGFLVSGLVHDLVISVPAGGGYGLPTGYFCLQGLAVLFERSRLAAGLGLGRGLRGWLFTVAVVAGPAYWLFHPTFVVEVIVPFLDAVFLDVGGAGRPS